jgi:hypothetical protein
MSRPSFPPTIPPSGIAFPPRGPRGAFPRFVGTPRCSDSLPPSDRAPSPSLGRTARGLAVRSQARGARLPGSRAWSPGCPSGMRRAERSGSPRFLGVPTARMPRSWTPVKSPRLAVDHDASMRSSAVVTASTSTVLNSRGSLTQPTRSLCTLRSGGYPLATQHSVPAGGQPLPGGIGTRRDAPEGFRECYPPHLILPLQASPGATQLLTIPRRRSARISASTRKTRTPASGSHSAIRRHSARIADPSARATRFGAKT